LLYFAKFDKLLIKVTIIKPFKLNHLHGRTNAKLLWALDIRIICMTKDIRYMTKQRQTILAELRKVESHPTADDVYELVRKQLPTISLATVYRNLEQMTQQGLIMKLDGGSQKRYDGNPENHYHFRCLKCDAMIDLPFEPSGEIQKMIDTLSDFEITDYDLNFTGLCPSCKQTKK
jgi:Fur family transcriptional regulator, peroxide stress response regulator